MHAQTALDRVALEEIELLGELLALVADQPAPSVSDLDHVLGRRPRCPGR